jgi:hypothetical protein
MAVASIMTLNLIVIIASLAVSMILIAFYKLHYIVEAVIFRRTNIIQIIENSEISGDRSTVIRRLGSSYCSTAAALLHSSSNEAIEKEKIENIISNSRCPFKFVMQVETININKLIDSLETKRNIREIELGRANNSGSKDNAAKINSLKRQIEQLDNEIEKISSGDTPLKVAQYIMTSAVSENKFNAQERAKSQLRELASQFGALLGTKSEMLDGNDLIQLLKFDSVIS